MVYKQRIVFAGRVCVTHIGRQEDADEARPRENMRRSIVSVTLTGKEPSKITSARFVGKITS